MSQSVFCVKCVSEKASLECSQCGQVFGCEAPAPLCEGCSNDVHQALTALHNIKSIACEEGNAKPDKTENEWMISVRSCENMIHEVQANCQLLKEQVQKSLDDFKQLLDTRQATLFANFDLVCERKVKLLSQHLEQLRAMATSHTGECGPSLMPPPFPAMPGYTSCGFVPAMATLQHATACLMVDCSDEVVELDRVSVTAIGSIDASGCFSLRILPDRDGLQDIMLQNISNSLEIDHALSPPPRPLNLHSGLLCSARYTIDQRWYRAKVVDPSSSRGKAKVYFLDHGNTEEVPTLSIGPLHDKYQVFPFQMLQCCFSVEPKFSYNKREVRWKFNDLTHGRSLTAVIMHRLPDNSRGKLFLIQLWDETSPQRLDVGASILALAEAMAGHHQKDSIKYRDVRYKDQPLPPNSKQMVTSSASTTSTVPSGSLAQATSLQPSNPQRTDPSAPTLSSHQPLPPSSTQEQADKSQALTQSITTAQKSETLATQKSEISPPLKSEIPATIEQTKLATSATMPQSELSQSPNNTSENAEESQPSAVVQSEVNQFSSDSVQAEDTSQFNGYSSSTMPSRPPSTTEKASEPQTSTPPHTQSSTATSNSMVQSESSTQPSVKSKAKDALTTSPPPVSSQIPLKTPASTHNTSQTPSLPSSDLTKSSPPVQPSQPSAFQSQSTLGAQNAYPTSSVNKEGIPSDKAPSNGVEVGVAKAEPGLISQDSSVDLKKETSYSTTKSEKGRDSSAAEEELLRLMHPSVVAGAELDVFVTTSLSPDGSFWVQLSLEDPSYDAMAEELEVRLSESRDIMTPVFFNPGDLCAGQYSEDTSWYRARVIAAREGIFTVRYLDFGNSEEREARHLAPLRSEFKQLPFQAVHCSIVSEDHTTFTQPEVDKFNQVVPTEEPVTINVLKLEGTTAYVEVLLKLSGRKSVDLTEEVYSADVSVFQSMDFGPSRTADVSSHESVPSVSLPLPLPPPLASDSKPSKKDSSDALPSPLTLPTSDNLTHPSNWADEMDAIQSPQDDGFLTLPGQDSRSHSERSKSPSPSPAEVQTRNQPQQQREAGPVDSVHSVESLSMRDRRSERESSRSTSPRPVHTAVRHHDDRDTRRAVSPANRSGSGIGSSRSAPRLNMGVATKQILSGIGHGRTSREGRRRERGEGPPAPPAGEKVTGNHQRPLEQNHVASSGAGERSPSPRRFPGPPPSQGSQSPDKHSTPPSRRRSPDLDITQLFVKNIPSSMSPSDISKLFASFGKVHKFVQDPQRKQVIYVHMSSENAQKAINGLHGKAISKNCHPLVVERSKEIMIVSKYCGNFHQPEQLCRL